MEKLFVPYQPSLDMKELGFDEPCLAFFWNTGKFYTCADYVHTISYHTQNQLGDYNYDSTSAPLYQQAFKWFREKYRLYLDIDPMEKYNFYYTIYDITQNKNEKIENEMYVFDSPERTYQEAELACLKKLIEIVKEK